jgi:signal peptidase I
VAVLLTGGGIFSALRTGPILALPLAFVPLAAAIGILRGRAWSGYGFALFLLGDVLLTPVLLLRRSAPAGKSSELIATAALGLVLMLLFLCAGRALAADGGERGRALPWMVLTILAVTPMIFVQAFAIPTGGMEDALLRGDRILVRVFPAPRPALGDIVVFVYPVDRRQMYVKRLVGIPGDRLRISQEALYRNGTAVVEPYASHKTAYMDPYRDNFPSQPDGPFLTAAAQEMLASHVVDGEVVVPAGKYFVLGDNRDNSLDSRYWGFIDTGDFIGKPLLIYDSMDARRIRWNRLFKLL